MRDSIGTARKAERQLTATALNRVLRSSLGLNLLKGYWGFNSMKEHIRIAGDFALSLAERTYIDPDGPLIWFNALFPPELVAALGVVPFYPEIVSALTANVGLDQSSLARASDAHYPLDLLHLPPECRWPGAAGSLPGGCRLR